MNRSRKSALVLILPLLAGGMLLAGCATTETGVTPASATNSPGRMAPIPNPTAQTTPRRKAAARQPRAMATATPSNSAVPGPAPRRAADPAKAAQLRAAGLEQLNRGAIDQAVALLRRANRLDPDNVLIRRDLDRAVRINNAVRAKS